MFAAKPIRKRKKSARVLGVHEPCGHTTIAGGIKVADAPWAYLHPDLGKAARKKKLATKPRHRPVPAALAKLWPEGLKKGQRVRYVGDRRPLQGCVGTVTRGAKKLPEWSGSTLAGKWCARWVPDDVKKRKVGHHYGYNSVRDGWYEVEVKALEPEAVEYRVDWRDMDDARWR